jgi:cyclic nucleotide gated channel
METKSLEVELWLSREGLPINLKEVIMQIIKQKLEQNQDVQVENILSFLPSAHSKYIKRYLRLAILKKVNISLIINEINSSGKLVIKIFFN